MFAWLNSLILRGYRNILSVDDLYVLDFKLTAAPLYSTFSQHWQEIQLQKRRYRLLRTTLKILKLPYLTPVLPRVALMAFTFCQLFLITSILKYIQSPHASSPNFGYGLIGAAAIIYIGVSISTSLYRYLHQRAVTMTRVLRPVRGSLESYPLTD